MVMIKYALAAIVFTGCSAHLPARTVSIPVVTSRDVAPRLATSTPHEAVRTATLPDSTWQVIEASDGGKEITSNSEFCPNEKQQTDGRFVFVHFEVTNRTTKEQIVL